MVCVNLTMYVRSLQSTFTETLKLIHINLSSPHLSATILLNCSKQTNRQYFKLYLHCYECNSQAKMLLTYKLFKDQTESQCMKQE